MNHPNSSLVSNQGIENLDPRTHIIIKGARVHNLKNLDVAIPRNQLVVITGLSGSGKSSLAFDTLFAEGQRMYVESLNSYARQFLGRMEKPAVDYIRGVSPAIAIEQKVNTKNPRSTVGTTTEIYDYLKLLFARIGKTYSPISGIEVKKDSVSVIVDWIMQFPQKKVIILAPLLRHEGRGLKNECQLLIQKGYTRLKLGDDILNLEELVEDDALLKKIDKNSADLAILVDRLISKADDEETQFRLGDSVQTAYFEGEGICWVELEGQKRKIFSDKFELDGISFEEPSLNLFSFNNPYGACKNCEGYGKVLGLDPDLVFPDTELSVYEGAIAPWRSERMSEWLYPLIRNGVSFDFPIHRPYKDLTVQEKQLLWTGNKYFAGLTQFFEHLEKETYKIQYRVLLSRYRGKTNCPECLGSRLRKDAAYVKIQGHSIIDMVLWPISKVKSFFDNLELNEADQQVSRRILIEIKNRLDYMNRVGLGYLTLNRLSSTLSGGEFQRIKLATSLGSALVGSMYILDEPSIGLHPRDTERLISVLLMLKQMGNTVIVVEHEEDIMRAADQIIDIGPEAGRHGGELMFQGNLEEALSRHDLTSHTMQFLQGIDRIEIPSFRRKSLAHIEIIGASENNLRNVSVKIPLGILTVVTGVSGSGKSTLIRKILYPALLRQLQLGTEETGKFKELKGSVSQIASVEMVDQQPIGKSSRSNPVTYIKAYDAIRALYAELPLAKTRGYKPSHFSFNVEGGRCETCQGEGEITIEMQFMADIKLVCESCQGSRFKQEILDIKFQDKNIAEILDMTVEEGVAFFKSKTPKIAEKIDPLFQVGLGYIKLGQSSNSLSGGEAQRVKLASFLGKGNPNKGKTLFIFDEPTTGLHFHDIKKLLKALNDLVEQGDSVIIIEHNMEVIKCADHIIDLGPDGGEAGGQICFEGSPEEMVKLENNPTAHYLSQKILGKKL
ncbi:excinuclease ABC subunit UvrA [Aquirufa nivalisilvae]|uniref:UvrABC system protein A n=1 Tax=Aquirufa nivalisilvae TaxID=2516557 RepID=A0A2S2DX67_9BACT|nr:excinuclease ABC subunit UvrA [Aquirufa nivalisilvae]AWL10001.1 UvrABC system protein [Aquirufa nivalisilvae]MCZ2480629.1 excinuclease ABC subunit UvrA [Aquirufa nivalisilvae]MCZ2482867.1 excinuclease ABC subunit UvrA [Aquirufa nivalisilvae]